LTIPKILLFAYGNPGRGDDALGPELATRIETKNLCQVECLVEMQLQVEHIIDLKDRERILFVDADMSCTEAYTFTPLQAGKDDSYTSHAMSPNALLHAYLHVYGTDAPNAYLLSIRGYRFGLGDQLSEKSRVNLELAFEMAQRFCVTSGHSGSMKQI